MKFCSVVIVLMNHISIGTTVQCGVNHISIGTTVQCGVNHISIGTTVQCGVTTWARGYKTYFMLNSVEHEILNDKYKNIKEFGLHLAQISRECYFSCS